MTMLMSERSKNRACLPTCKCCDSERSPKGIKQGRRRTKRAERQEWRREAIRQRYE